MLDHPNPHDLPSLTAAADAPEAVRDAVTAAHDAGAIREQARSELAAAKAAVDQADAVDAAADKTAVAAGKPLPSKKAGPKAREAEAEAKRKAEAAESGYIDAVRTLTSVMLAEQIAWLEQIGTEERARVDEVREAIESLAAASDRLAELRTLRAELEPFRADRPKPMAAWRGVSFYSKRARRPSSEKRSEIRNSIRRLAIADNSRDELLVELELLVTGERPWEERDRQRQSERRGEHWVAAEDAR